MQDGSKRWCKIVYWSSTILLPLHSTLHWIYDPSCTQAEIDQSTNEHLWVWTITSWDPSRAGISANPGWNVVDIHFWMSSGLWFISLCSVTIDWQHYTRSVISVRMATIVYGYMYVLWVIIWILGQLTYSNRVSACWTCHFGALFSPTYKPSLLMLCLNYFWLLTPPYDRLALQC